jgi:serine/threonine protein kinase
MRLQRGQVEEPVMMKWLCQLLLALDYLQTMKVLHRDIKTSNLLLTCDMDVQLGRQRCWAQGCQHYMF